MCGAVSFKRGDSFHRANKVTFTDYGSDRCEAVVSGNEDFQVVIERDFEGSITKSCDCPKLASFQKDCQHIAAVLLSIYEHQRLGTLPENHSSADLTQGFMSIFQQEPKRTSSKQRHFEKREMMRVEFVCHAVTISNNQMMIGIEMKVADTYVQQIRLFLEQVRQLMPTHLSPFFQYDPNIHYFLPEADAVIQELIQVLSDEKVYMDETGHRSDYLGNQQLLLVPPTSWERLLPLLDGKAFVKLVDQGKTYVPLRSTTNPLSLNFQFAKKENSKNFQLQIAGLDQMVVLSAYHSVLANGAITKLAKDDCKRLTELKQMLEQSGTSQIPISEEQVPFFLEKIVPGLKRLGEVEISGIVSESSKPLVAKLYLDRVNHRLLAGLEFHYEHIVINPCENREPKTNTLLIRDIHKEEQILEIMNESEFVQTDGGYYLQNEELEYEFLYYVMPKLEKLVQVYATTAVKIRIFKGNMFPKIRIKAKKERTNWLEFKFEINGKEEREIREILSALEEKRKYYRLRDGSLLSLQTKEFDDIQQFLARLPGNSEDLINGLDVPIVKSLPFLDAVNDERFFSLEESFSQFLEAIRHPGKMQFDLPKDLEPILREYQKQGYHWLKTLASFGFGGILADDMGLGKTLQSITYIVSELADIREKKLPILIVCPSSLSYNWLSEIIKFAPQIEAVVIDGEKKGREKLQEEAMNADVVITSYPLLRKDIQWFEKQAFHTVFFDEAQAFKNPLTQTARAVLKINADYRFALTGTPVENSSVELWAIFHVVFPELFQGLKDYSNLPRETIARRIRPFLLRRVKENVLAELPEKEEILDTVELLPEQKHLYGAYLAKLREDTLKHLDKETIRKNRIRILAGLTRLRQICCHPGLFVDGYKGSSAKFEQLLKIINEAQLSGRRVLIFSQFTKMLEIISRELAAKDIAFFYLDGQTPSEERVETCQRFNSGERDFFLISLKAGGTGLNLTGADTVILYDLWWNPAVEEQAADRAHRIGQENVVQVIKLVAKGTIEEKINELQEKKRNLIEEMISSDTKMLTEDDIREILT